MPRKTLSTPYGARYVSHITLEEYADWYRDFFVITRDDQGVCTLRMHTKGGVALISHAFHRAIGQVIKFAGMDPENELLILTGTGDRFIGGVDLEFAQSYGKWLAANPFAAIENSVSAADEVFDNVSSIVFDVKVPTIGVINGPYHALPMLATYCDLTLCADDTTFHDRHFPTGAVAGDGLLIGDKRAAHLSYTNASVDAQTAQAWGIVNEVLPRDELMPRAYEIAAEIMKQDRHVRQLTRAIMRRRLGRRLMEEMNFELAVESWSAAISAANRIAKAGNG